MTDNFSTDEIVRVTFLARVLDGSTDRDGEIQVESIDTEAFHYVLPQWCKRAQISDDPIGALRRFPAGSIARTWVKIHDNLWVTKSFQSDGSTAVVQKNDAEMIGSERQNKP